jgi:hypothetical protein
MGEKVNIADIFDVHRRMVVKSFFLEISRAAIVEKISSTPKKDSSGRRVLEDRRKGVEKLIRARSRDIKRSFKRTMKLAKVSPAKFSVVTVFDTMKEGESLANNLPENVIKKYRVFVIEKETFLQDRNGSVVDKGKRNVSKTSDPVRFLSGSLSGGSFEQK